MRAFVFVAAIKIPKLDTKRPQDVDQPAKNMNGATKAIGMPRSSAKNAPRHEIVEQ